MSDIAQSLDILLPTLNGIFPVELVSLSNSLLAQSRTRASLLKPGEEIARPYACADIACRRLNQKLKLPTLAGRPPCPPRPYKKLYALLDQSLPARAPKNLIENQPRNARSSQPATPSKNGKSMSTRTASSGTKRKLFAGDIHLSGGGLGLDKEAPAFIMPIIRGICAAFHVKDLIPHIFTGASIVFGLSDLSNSQPEEEARTNVSTMVVALFFLVLAKARVGTFDEATFKSQSDKALRIANIGTLLGKEGMEQWIERITNHGWAEGQEWWENVPAGVVEGQFEEELGDADLTKTTRRHKRAKEMEEDDILRPGLGTMVQEGNSWLSEDKRHAFDVWKSDILARVGGVENDRL